MSSGWLLRIPFVTRFVWVICSVGWSPFLSRLAIIILFSSDSHNGVVAVLVCLYVRARVYYYCSYMWIWIYYQNEIVSYHECCRPERNTLSEKLRYTETAWYFSLCLCFCRCDLLIHNNKGQVGRIFRVQANKHSCTHGQQQKKNEGNE